MSHTMIANATHIGRDIPIAQAHALVLERIKKRLIVNDRGCWIWTGATNLSGYGQLVFRAKRWMVHRLVYTILVGEIPPDGPHGQTVMCHSCDEKLCANPAHLWPGSEKDNMQDCVKKGRLAELRVTQCPKGHPYDAENTYIHKKPDGRTSRGCRACSRLRSRNDPNRADRQRARRARQRLASQPNAGDSNG